MMISLVPHKLQRKTSKIKSARTFQSKSFSLYHPTYPPAVNMVIRQATFCLLVEISTSQQLLKQKPTCETYKYSLINMSLS